MLIITLQVKGEKSSKDARSTLSSVERIITMQCGVEERKETSIIWSRERHSTTLRAICIHVAIAKQEPLGGACLLEEKAGKVEYVDGKQLPLACEVQAIA